MSGKVFCNLPSGSDLFFRGSKRTAQVTSKGILPSEGNIMAELDSIYLSLQLHDSATVNDTPSLKGCIFIISDSSGTKERIKLSL